MNFFNLGIQQTNSEELNAKIVLTNYLAVFMFTFSGINTLNFLVNVPQVSYFPTYSAIGALSSILLNHWKLYRASRVVISFVCINSVFLFYSLTHPEGSTPTLATVMLAFAFSLLPFSLFRAKEWQWMTFSYFVNALMLFFLEDSPALFAYKIDVELAIINSIQNQLVMKLSAIAVVILIFTFFIRFNTKIANTNLSLKKEIKKQNDHLTNSQSELREQLNQLESKRKEEEKRMETAQHLKGLNEIVRHADNLSQAYDKITSYLVKCVKANQAGLYIVEEEEDRTSIVLKACFAYDRKKHISQQIEVGEGLLGQAYLEKQKTLLTEIPQNYTSITSGLGDATPHCLLILPLIHQEKVEGLLEVASFNIFEEYQLEMLEQAGTTLASEISSDRIHQRTNVLLTEAQQQTEQLQAQEEELRQNMEELQATQETMLRKEKEMNDLLHQIEEKEAYTRAVFDNALDGIVMTDEYGIIEMFNPAAELIFGYTVAEMIGKNIKMLMPSPHHEQHDGYLNHYRQTRKRNILGNARKVEGLRKSGEKFPLEIRVETGQINERKIFVGMLRDLTKESKRPSAKESH